MSTITKERAQEIFLVSGPEPTASEERELARIALASLEAEPVAYIRDGFKADGVHFCGGIITAEEHERTKPALSDRYNWKHQPLYAAPPSPVVPDAIPKLKDGQRFKYVKDGIRYSANYANGWNACRAAMLQGAEPVQGWIPCSELMPEQKQSNRYIGLNLLLNVRTVVQGGFDDGSFWLDGVRIDNVTHWMLLSAAPQQEA